jgi:hypothetical protein
VGYPPKPLQGATRLPTNRQNICVGVIFGPETLS